MVLGTQLSTLGFGVEGLNSHQDDQLAFYIFVTLLSQALCVEHYVEQKRSVVNPYCS